MEEHSNYYMTEEDLKFLIGSYQQRSQDLFTQLVAIEAKNMQLNQTVELLSAKIKELESKDQSSSLKSKRSTKQTSDFT
jgi:hypothetical protein